MTAHHLGVSSSTIGSRKITFHVLNDDANDRDPRRLATGSLALTLAVIVTDHRVVAVVGPSSQSCLFVGDVVFVIVIIVGRRLSNCQHTPTVCCAVPVLWCLGFGASWAFRSLTLFFCVVSCCSGFPPRDSVVRSSRPHCHTVSRQR